MLGAAISELPRSEVVIATKIGLAADGARVPLRQANVEEQVQRSCERLRLDHIDLLQIERMDPEIPLEETLEALAVLHRRGQVGDVGFCDAPAETLLWARLLAGERAPAPSTNQVMCNLLHPCGADAARKSRAAGAAVIAYGALAGGLLTCKYDTGVLPEGSRGARFAGYADRWLTPLRLEFARSFGRIARAWGERPERIAVAWVARAIESGAVLVGATSPDQLEELAGRPLPDIDSELDARLARLVIEAPPSTLGIYTASGA